MSKKFLGVFVILFAAVFCSQLVLGQGGTTGTIFGTVKDVTDAVLPGTEVTVTNVDTGRSRTLISDDEGRYRASNLNLGTYEITASLPGFQTAVRRGVTMTIGREAVVDLTLNVGEITERVTVTSEAPLVETTSGGLGDLVDRNTVLNLPLNGRDLTSLLTLQAGTAVATNASTGASPGYSIKVSISGARPQDNAVLLDGTEVKGIDGGVPAGMSGNFIGVEAIQEFKIERNAYSAQYGGNAGGVINVVSKSGSNEFHGSLYEFHRNDNLDAAKFEDNRAGVEKPEFIRNQFGVSVGGPVIRNRTFFFFNYEGLRERLGQTSIQTTWTDATRAEMLPGHIDPVTGEFEYVPYEPVIPVPGGFDPDVLPYLALWPDAEPGSEERFDGTVRQYVGVSRPTDEDFWQARIDHNLSDSDFIFGRVTRQVSGRTTPGSSYWSSESFQPNLFITIEEKRIFSPQLLNTFRAAFNRRGQGQNSFENNLPSGLDYLKFVPLDEWQAPLGAQWTQGEITGAGASSVGVGRGWVDRKINRFQYADDVIYNRGSHSWKFGMDWQRIQYNGTNPSRPAGQFSFNGVEGFLLRGEPTRFRGDISPDSDGIRGLRWNIAGWYIQDDWEVIPQLTLNLGFRHEFFTVPYEVNGKIANLKNPLTDSEITVLGTRGDAWFENPSMKSFAPRIGLAWDPTGSGKMAIRAGGGIFYNHVSPGTFRQAAHRTAPFLIETNIRGSAVRDLFPAVFDAVAAGAGQGDMHLFPYDYAENPHTYQWNLNIQREILPQMALTVGYAGSRGVNLVKQVFLNTARADVVNGRFVFPDDAELPADPAFVELDLLTRDTSGDAWYNSLQVGLRRRFQDGYQYQLSYTWSKTQDTASQINNDFGLSPVQAYYFEPFMRKSLSPWDVRNNFTASWVAELPFGQGRALGSDWSGVAQRILGDWQMGGILSIHDGSPSMITMGRPSSLDGLGYALGSVYPDLVPGMSNNPVLGSGDRAEQYFDPLAFQLPPQQEGGAFDGEIRTIGNVGRNTLIGPGFAQLDFSLIKNTYASEDVKVEFRAEGFNLLNRANLGNPSTSVFSGSGSRSSTAGRIASTRSERQIQLGVRITF